MAEVESCVYNFSNYKGRLLEQLHTQQYYRLFCDVNVRLEGADDVSAHRCILAASSTKLQLMLVKSDEKNQVLDLPDISLSAFNVLMQYFYTGSVKIDSANCDLVYNAAKQLELSNVEKVCENFMKRTDTKNSMNDRSRSGHEQEKDLTFRPVACIKVAKVRKTGLKRKEKMACSVDNSDFTKIQLDQKTNVSSHCPAYTPRQECDNADSKAMRHSPTDHVIQGDTFPGNNTQGYNLVDHMTRDERSTGGMTQTDNLSCHVTLGGDHADHMTSSGEGEIKEEVLNFTIGDQSEEEENLKLKNSEVHLQMSPNESIGVICPDDRSGIGSKRRVGVKPSDSKRKRKEPSRIELVHNQELESASDNENESEVLGHETDPESRPDSIQVLEKEEPTEEGESTIHTPKQEGQDTVHTPKRITRGRKAKKVEWEGGRRHRESLSCSVCTRQFVDKKSHDRHVRMHSHDDSQTYECDTCRAVFSHRWCLTRHMDVEHPSRTFTCQDCGKEETHPSRYKQHCIQEHNNKLPFYCVHEGCKARKKTLSSLAIHVQIHDTVKKFVCEDCGLGFAQEGGLHSHRRSCLDKREYLCDLCGKKFNHQASLNNHRLLHTQQKPLECAVCKARFSHHSNLRRHLRVHSNVFPYPCPSCDKKFRHSNTLKMHAKSHHHLTLSSSDMAKIKCKTLESVAKTKTAKGTASSVPITTACPVVQEIAQTTGCAEPMMANGLTTTGTDMEKCTRKSNMEDMENYNQSDKTDLGQIPREEIPVAVSLPTGRHETEIPHGIMERTTTRMEIHPPQQQTEAQPVLSHFPCGNVMEHYGNTSAGHVTSLYEERQAQMPSEPEFPVVPSQPPAMHYQQMF